MKRYELRAARLAITSERAERVWVDAEAAYQRCKCGCDDLGGGETGGWSTFVIIMLQYDTAHRM